MLTKESATHPNISNHTQAPLSELETSSTNIANPGQWNGQTRPTPQQILTLQRTIGNQAVQNLLTNFRRSKRESQGVTTSISGQNSVVQRFITTNASDYMKRAIQVRIGATDFQDYKAKKDKPDNSYSNQSKHWQIELMRHLSEFFRLKEVSTDYNQFKDLPAIKRFYTSYSQAFDQHDWENGVEHLDQMVIYLNTKTANLATPITKTDDLDALESKLSQVNNPDNLIKNQLKALERLVGGRGSGILNGNVADDLARSVKFPHLIDQGQFALCGPNDVLIAVASKDPLAYVNYMIDIYSFKKSGLATGTAKLGNMTVPLQSGVMGATLNANDKIAEQDWMGIASLREGTNKEAFTSTNPLVGKILHDLTVNGLTIEAVAAKYAPTTGGIDALSEALKVMKQKLNLADYVNTKAPTTKGPAQVEFEMKKMLAAVTLPPDVVNWFTKIGGNVLACTANPFNPTKNETDLMQASSFLGGGKIVMLNINSDTLNTTSYNTITSYNISKAHWVILKSPVTKNTGVTPNELECETTTWGEEKRVLKIAVSQLSNAYFGFLAVDLATPQP